MLQSFAPLDKLPDFPQPSGATHFRLSDAAGCVYAEGQLDGWDSSSQNVGGALGTHRIDYLDDDGRLIGARTFDVDCRTGIDDASGRLRAFHDQLYGNFFVSHEISSGIFEGKPVAWISPWFRNFAMLIDGARYYDSRFLSLFEVGAKTQREDGMIWDSVAPVDPEVPYFDGRYKTSGWTGLHPSQDWRYLRLQVECDVEHFYVEGLHAAWKACGNNEWARPLLDAAAKGLNYLLTDSLRFSRKFQLVRRGATIDTWDFMTDAESARTGNVMEAIEGITNFVILHSDNTGVAHACDLLAEMLDACGEPGGEDWRNRGRQILERVEKIAWNGEFFQHWVREDDSGALPEPDAVTDESRQVSMGNAYYLNRRGAEPQKAEAILQTYQKLASEVPDERGREYYFIYPPFFTSFTHCPEWHYSNGGIFPCVGAELAQGAFRFGWESYGLQLLDKLHEDLQSSHGIFPYYYLGKTYEPPERTFEVLDIREQANVDFAAEGAPGVPGWTGESPENDLSPMPTGDLEFERIPVHVIDPASNGRRACIGLSPRDGYLPEVEIPVGRTAGCIYLHHTMSGRAGEKLGAVEICYSDGATVTVPVRPRLDVPSWWGPKSRPYPGHRPGGYVMKVAWSGWNQRALVGTGIWGLDNPHPEREIRALRLIHAGDSPSFWFILGLTLSDAAHWFPFPDRDKHAVLQTEHAGSTLEALFGGLAGIEDSGTAFDNLTLSPRCIVDPRLDDGVTFTTRYPLSKGYCRYHWSFDRAQSRVSLRLSTSAKHVRLRLLLPEHSQGDNPDIRVNGTSQETTIETAGASRYACLNLQPQGQCLVEGLL